MDFVLLIYDVNDTLVDKYYLSEIEEADDYINEYIYEHPFEKSKFVILTEVRIEYNGNEKLPF